MTTSKKQTTKQKLLDALKTLQTTQRGNFELKENHKQMSYLFIASFAINIVLLLVIYGKAIHQLISN